MVILLPKKVCGYLTKKRSSVKAKLHIHSRYASSVALCNKWFNKVKIDRLQTTHKPLWALASVIGTTPGRKNSFLTSIKEAIQLEIVCINANVHYETLINCIQIIGYRYYKTLHHYIWSYSLELKQVIWNVETVHYGWRTTINFLQNQNSRRSGSDRTYMPQPRPKIKYLIPSTVTSGTVNESKQIASDRLCRGKCQNVTN